MRICELMEQRGIQRIQLADAMGVSPSCITKWVQGTALPSADKLPRLAAILRPRAARGWKRGRKLRKELLMIRTPEQRQIARWIENHYDIDKVQCAEVVTKNAVRLTLRGHEPTILILRQNGRVDQIPEAALFEAAV